MRPHGPPALTIAPLVIRLGLNGEEMGQRPLPRGNNAAGRNGLR
jgi:hypothetical protein